MFHQIFISLRTLKPKDSQRAYLWCLSGLVLLASIVYASVIDHTASWDDSLVYLVGAKSIALNQGYRLINMPPPAPIPIYPPLFPAMLSLLWRLFPDYPANLPLLKIVALISALAYAVLSAEILKLEGRRLWLILLAVAMFLFHVDVVQMVGSSVFSDLPFAAITMFGLLRLKEEGKSQQLGLSIALLGVVIAAGILIRALGVALWVVATAYLMFGQKKIKKAGLIFVLGIPAISWFMWQSMATTTPPKRLWQYGGLSSYSEWYRYAPANNGEMRQRNMLEIGKMLIVQEPKKLQFLFTEGVARVCAGFGYDLLRRNESHRAPVLRWGMIFLSVIIAAGVFIGLVSDWRSHSSPLHLFILVYCLIAASAPFDSVFITRYLMPLWIFFNYFLLLSVSKGAKFIQNKLAKTLNSHLERNFLPVDQLGAISVVLMVLLPNLAFAIHHIDKLHAKDGPRGSYYALASERTDTYNWIKEHTAIDDIIAAHYAGEVYLVTGRLSIPFMSDSIKELHAQGVRWLVMPIDNYRDMSPLLESENALVRWRSTSGRFTIYELPAFK